MMPLMPPSPERNGGTPEYGTTAVSGNARRADWLAGTDGLVRLDRPLRRLPRAVELGRRPATAHRTADSLRCSAPERPV